MSAQALGSAMSKRGMIPQIKGKDKPNVMQSLYLYNYQTSIWEQMGKRLVGNTDDDDDDVAVSVVINLNPEICVSQR